MEVAHPRHQVPGTLSLLCREDIGVAHRPGLVGSHQRIELALMILQRGGPLTTSIDRTLQQVVLGRVRQSVEDIADGLPVFQVLRGHHRGTRHQVHRCRHQIERVTHADHVRVRHIRPQHRVLDRLRLQSHIVVSLHTRREQASHRHQERPKISLPHLFHCVYNYSF